MENWIFESQWTRTYWDLINLLAYGWRTASNRTSIFGCTMHWENIKCKLNTDDCMKIAWVNQLIDKCISAIFCYFDAIQRQCHCAAILCPFTFHIRIPFIDFKTLWLVWKSFLSSVSIETLYLLFEWCLSIHNKTVVILDSLYSIIHCNFHFAHTAHMPYAHRSYKIWLFECIEWFYLNASYSRSCSRPTVCIFARICMRFRTFFSFIIVVIWIGSFHFIFTKQ